MSDLTDTTLNKVLSFSFTKFVVSDVEAGKRFYCDAFGIKMVHRNTATEHEYAQEETILTFTGTMDSNLLILTRCLDRPCPAPSEAWVGFVVSDIEATLAGVERAGGHIVVPLHENSEHGVRAVIAVDPAGHMIELIQMTRPYSSPP